MIQYFLPNSEDDWNAFAGALAAFFVQSDEEEMRFRTLNRDRLSFTIKMVSPDQYQSIIFKAISASFERVIDFANAGVLRSMETCRAFYSDDDGLARVVYVQDDDVIDLSHIGIETADLSHWLITTDIFDTL